MGCNKNENVTRKEELRKDLSSKMKYRGINEVWSFECKYREFYTLFYNESNPSSLLEIIHSTF